MASTAFQIAERCVHSGIEIYVCPACKNIVRYENDALLCDICRKTFPIQDGIPDFILEELSQSRDPVLRSSLAFHPQDAPARPDVNRHPASNDTRRPTGRHAGLRGAPGTPGAPSLRRSQTGNGKAK